LHTNNLNWLNSASIALIPNKEGAEEVTDFRPISLVHAIAKLISKMMATRLAPFMHIGLSLPLKCIHKKRSMHASSLYVRNLEEVAQVKSAIASLQT
jgi:hypothetical protein